MPTNLLSTLSVDNVIFGYEAGQLSVLLVRHGVGLSAGHWGFPGDWPTERESLEDCAARSLHARTGLREIELRQLHTFSAVDRYPEHRVVTTVFYTVIKQFSQPIRASADEMAAQWFELDQVPQLIFDHDEILRVALNRLRDNARHQPIGLGLLARKFTLLQLQELYQAIFGRQFDKPNFRRKWLSYGLLVPLDESVRSGGHRSAKLFRFDLRAYRRVSTQGYSFNL